MRRPSGADGQEAIFGRFFSPQASLARVDGKMRELSPPIAQTLSALARLELLEINGYVFAATASAPRVAIAQKIAGEHPQQAH